MTATGTENRSGDDLLDLPAPSRKDQRWTLLLVGDSGRIIRIRRARGWLALLIALPVIALALVAGGYFRSEKRSPANRAAIQEVARLQAVVRLLNEENARLSAQGVDAYPAAVTPQAKAPDPIPATVSDSPRGVSPAATQAPEPFDSGDNTDDTAEMEQLTGEPARSETTSPAVVEVKDLTVDLDSDAHSAQVRFKIVNRLADGEPFSGYAFVVVKPAGQGDDLWLVFPETAFGHEGPASYEGGFDFTISNFMFIKFKPRQIGADRTFHSATVLVYDTAGQLVLKTDFELDQPR